ncbi:MAG: hypothetical protein M1814_006798 [Vezdaea aestivalis]|nr:MAG: hypothetical protein M1814_006798 [Vezdaea aestivalis]
MSHDNIISPYGQHFAYPNDLNLAQSSNQSQPPYQFLARPSGTNETSANASHQSTVWPSSHYDLTRQFPGAASSQTNLDTPTGTVLSSQAAFPHGFTTAVDETSNTLAGREARPDFPAYSHVPQGHNGTMVRSEGYPTLEFQQRDPINENDSQRKLAKAAVRDLFDRGVPFAQLIDGESYEFEEALKTLWHELGFPLPQRYQEQYFNGSASDGMQHPRVEPEEGTSSATHSFDQLAVGQPRNTPQNGPLPSNSLGSQEDNVQNENKAVEVDLASLNTPTAATVEPITPIPKNLNVKSAPAQEERKDRIARLMAQKASKSSVQASQVHKPLVGQALGQQVMNDQAADTRDSVPTPNIAPKNVQPSNNTGVATASRQPKTTEATQLILQKIAEQKRKKAESAQQIQPPVQPVDIPQAEDHTDRFPLATLLSAEQRSAMTTPMHGDNLATRPSPNLSQLGSSLIPGLFMSSNSITPQDSSLPPSPVTNLPSNSVRQKRPVASDFDDDVVASPHDPKRPFGQMKNNARVIIDVSDDSASEAGEITANNHENAAPVDEGAPSLSKHSSRLFISPKVVRDGIRNQPPLTDLSSRNSVLKLAALKQMSSPNALNLAQKTVPRPAGLQDGSAIKSLREKEDEIRLLNERIARLERAKQSRNGVDTPSNSPRILLPKAVPTTTSFGPTSQLDSASIAPSPLGDKIRQTSEGPRMLSTISNEIEARQARKAILEAELISINAARSEARSKAEELKREMERWQAIANSEENERKRTQLMNELEELGIEATEKNIAKLELFKSTETRDAHHDDSELPSEHPAAIPDDNINSSALALENNLEPATFTQPVSAVGSQSMELESVISGSASHRALDDAMDVDYERDEPKESDSLEEGELSSDSVSSISRTGKEPELRFNNRRSLPDQQVTSTGEAFIDQGIDNEEAYQPASPERSEEPTDKNLNLDESDSDMYEPPDVISREGSVGQDAANPIDLSSNETFSTNGNTQGDLGAINAPDTPNKLTNVEIEENQDSLAAVPSPVPEVTHLLRIRSGD